MSNQNNLSALIMCQPNLKGFFYSKKVEFIFQKIVQTSLSKNKSFCVGKIKTPIGDSYLIVLPKSTKQMKLKNLEERWDIVLTALKLAENLGAKKISFAGLLPSLLDHFKNFPEDKFSFDKITTGHTATSLSIGLMLEKIIKNKPAQSLAFVGLGSIGRLSLFLTLEKVLKPKKIILCDLRKREKELLDLADQIQNQYGVSAEISYYNEESFLNVYRSDIILGAVSSKSILNPYLLKKGAILIDDSFPPILSIKDSIDRMKTKKDVLILTAGKLDIGTLEFKSSLWFLPKFFVSYFMKQNKGLPGCWAEALLACKWPDLFLAKNATTKSLLLKVWDQKEDLNLKLPDFHLANYKIPLSLENLCKGGFKPTKL